jgi:hypothetical protein
VARGAWGGANCLRQIWAGVIGGKTVREMVADNPLVLAASVENAQASWRVDPPGPGPHTVGEWSARGGSPLRQLKPLTLKRYGNNVRVQILPEWDRVRLSPITHADVVSWVASLQAKGYAAPTVRQVHRVFSLMLTLPVRDSRMPEQSG